MEDNDYQQHREKSLLGKVGDFLLNALVVVAAILAVVSLSAIFSDTVSNKLDEWTKDKDGKGGWGSAIRKAVGVSTENNTSAGNKLSEMADKASKTVSGWTESLFPGDKAGKKEGVGVSDVAAGGAVLYGAKKMINAANRPVHVDADGNSHTLPKQQIETAKNVKLAQEKLEAAILAEKEAAQKVANLKPSKIMEDEALKKQNILKRLNPLKKTPANAAYTKAVELHNQASETLVNLKTVITEGEEALAKGLEPNSTRFKEFVKKFSIPSTETVVIEATPPPLKAGPATTPPEQTIKVGKNGFVEFSNTATANPPGVAAGEAGVITPTEPAAAKPPAQPTAAIKDEPLKPKAEPHPKTAGEAPSVRGKVGKASGLLGIIAATISIIRGDFQNIREHWNHKDEKGNPDSRGTAVLQGVGTAADVAGIALIIPTGGYSIAFGTATKEALSMGHEYVTGKPGGITQSLVGSAVEATGTEAKELARDIYNATGLSDEAKELAKAKQKQEHDKAIEQAMSRLTPEHKAAFDAWFKKAKEHGRDDIDPLILMEQVKDHNFRLPVPNTPNANALAKSEAGK